MELVVVEPSMVGLRRAARSGLVLAVAGGLAAFLVAAGCRQLAHPRAERSFDEIQRLVTDQSADEVLALLGEPDSRQVVFDADERWIWWNYTYLDGNDHPPELRGQVVHLEIVFRNPDRSRAERRPLSEWRVDAGLGAAFQLPSSDLSR